MRHLPSSFLRLEASLDVRAEVRRPEEDPAAIFHARHLSLLRSVQEGAGSDTEQVSGLLDIEQPFHHRCLSTALDQRSQHLERPSSSLPNEKVEEVSLLPEGEALVYGSIGPVRDVVGDCCAHQLL
ncbi:MAG: hypothetical protein A2V77_22185 [Anaeromyxobacter sp. RBG_16_69_14]|nr:MAG: hypothetical protein A2V77_22185 [Anaeromyxobacter sp. RBG_16_69_14]